MTCSRSWELRAIDEGRLGSVEVAALERHARGCESCQRGLAEQRDLRALAGLLPVVEPSELALRRLRSRVLEGAMRASAGAGRFPHHAAAWGAGLIGAAAIGIVAAAHLASARATSSPVLAAPVVSSEWPVARSAAAPPEPAPVGVPDPPAPVGVASQPLPASAPAAPPARAPAPRVAAPAVARRAPADADRELSDYQRAVDAYRLGRFESAADLLHAFGAAHPDSALVDDALFLEASSLASAGEAEAAGAVAAQHLARFPGSFHRRDASVLAARGRAARAP